MFDPYPVLTSFESQQLLGLNRERYYSMYDGSSLY